MKFGKKYTDSVKLIDTSKLYDAGEAIDLVCQTSKAKFDETIELHIRLGVDSEPVRPSALSYLQRVMPQRLLPRQAPTMSARLTSQRRSRRKTGSTSMLLSQLPT